MAGVFHTNICGGVPATTGLICHFLCVSAVSFDSFLNLRQKAFQSITQKNCLAFVVLMFFEKLHILSFFTFLGV